MVIRKEIVKRNKIEFYIIVTSSKIKTLLILRHGKSSWKFADLADHDRPLNKRGKSDAPKIGKLEGKRSCPRCYYKFNCSS